MTDSLRIFSYIPDLSRLTWRKAARKPSQVQLNLQNLEARVTPAAALTSDLLQPGLAALQLGQRLDGTTPSVDMTAQAGVSNTDARLLSAAFMATPVNQPAAPSISLMVTTPSHTGSLVAAPSYSTSSISVSPFKLQLSSSDPLASTVRQGASQAFASLRAFSQSPAFASTLKEVFGGNANAALLRYGLTQNGINIRVQLVSGSELPGARAAYAQAGADGVETIYLNRDWLAKSRSVSEVRDLLIEELGHALDVRVNGASDSAGDEGDLFMRRVTGKAISADTLAALKVENDHATVTIAGKRVAIEMATAPFQGAYKLLESVEESATATTTTAIVGTNFAFTSADPTQVQFSGNNVPGTFSYTDSNNQVVSINGEVSRLIKDKGLQAVYFHTIGFDNAGSWMLVVNPSYFQNNTQYKTSSDPVDQALNGLISAAPTQTTVITSVTDDVSPQTGLVNNGGYTNDTSPLISGTISAALGTSEVVAVFRDGTYIGVATVSGTTWTFADSGLANGTNYTYTAAVVNSSTQASAPLSNSYVVKVDTQAPALTFSPITGDDNITQAEKNAGVTLTGTAEPGATVAISYVDASGNTVTRNATVDANGNWSYALTANDWTNIGNASSVQFTATATDLAGNTSSTSRTALLAPPAMAVPGVPDLVTADDTGTSNTDNVTSKTTVQLTVAVPNSGANPALPGQWLEIVDANGQVLGSHVLTEDDIRTGSYTFIVPNLQQGTYTISSRLVDTVTNTTSVSQGSLLLTIDTTAPLFGVTSIGEDTGASPTDKITNDRELTITGTGEPGSTINVYDNGVLVGTAVVGPDGKYSVTTSPLADGSHPLTITASDPAGNVNGPTSLGTWVIDTQAPTLTNLSVSEDTGLSPTDKITSDRVLTVSGTTEPNSFVQIYDTTSGTPVLVGQGYADANGKFSIDTNVLADGSHPLTITSTDPAGNVSQPVSLGTWVIDTSKPAAPTNLSVSEDTGLSPTDKITSDRVLTVTGTAEPNSLVKIYDSSSGTPVLVGQGFADANGNFSIDTSVLADGAHPLTITATDAAGNESQPASLGTWVIDTSKPAAPTNLSVSEDTGVSPTDKITSDRVLTVTGTAEPNSLVKVYDSTSGTPVLVGQGFADANGNFSIDTSVLADGAHPLSITATDAAGNESSPASLGTWVIDTQAPAFAITSVGLDIGSSPTDKLTSDNVLTVTGTGEPGAIVKIFDNGQLVGTGTIQPNGTFSIDTSVLADGSHPLTATASDLAGNVNGPVSLGTWVIDTQAPLFNITSVGLDTGSSPTDKLTNDNVLTVTGTGEPGATVKIYDNGQLVGTGTVQPDGTFSIDTSVLADGSHPLTATATDAAGNVSVPKSLGTWVIDTQAPTFVITSVGQDTGSSPTDKLTNDNVLTVTGTGEPGATVKIYDNGQLVGTGLIGPDGKFSIDTSVLADGSHPLTATATDPAGNVSAPKDLGTWVIDTQAPSFAITSVGLDTGSSPTDKLTNDNVLTVTGTGEPGATVKIYDNGQLVGTGTVQPDGTFSIDTSVLADGSHPLTATVTDPAGNVSAPKDLGTWVVDTQAPLFNITSVGLDTGSSPTDKLTNDNILTVTGTGEPGATVKIYDNGQLVGTGTIQPDGTFSIDTSVLADGSHPLTATATDAAGNVSAPKSLGTWIIDTQAPAFAITSVGLDTGSSPTDKLTNDNVLTVTGTGEPGATVKIYDNGQLVGTGTVQPDGTFSIDTSVLADGSHPLTATATDPAGNVSAPKDLGTWIIDTKAPAFNVINVGLDTGTSPTDKLTNDNVLTVTGTGEPGATVRIYDNGQLVGTGTVQPDGTFSIDTSVLADGAHPLTATATDAAGNVNGPKDLGTWVIDTKAPAFNVTSVGQDTGLNPTDKVTSDNALTITGTGEPGAVVTVYDNGKPVGTGTVGPDGKFSITTDALPDGSHPLTATATDPAGNVAAPLDLGTWVIDTKAPEGPQALSVSEDTGLSPTDKLTNDRELTVTGIAEPNSLVKVYDTSSGVPVLVGQGYADVNGHFSVTTSPLADGAHPLSITASDLAGNESGPVSLGTWTIDATKPLTPIALSVSEDTGSSPTDKVTSDRELTVTGKAEPNSLVKVYDTSSGSPVLVGEGFADGNGNFSITTSPLADGSHPLSITATDAAGNESGPTSLGTWVIDTTAPQAPAVVNMGEDTADPADKVTSDNTLTISGTGEPGSTITVYADGVPVGTATVGPDGKYSVTTSPLADGSYPISITATDPAGNESAPTDLGVWVIDTQAPAAPQVASVSIDTNKPDDKVTSDNVLTVTGTAEPNSLVKVYDSSSGTPVLVGEGYADANGNYSIDTDVLADGEHPLSVTATDKAGNESAPTDLGTWIIDTNAPAQPAITGFGEDTGNQGDGFTQDNDLFLVGTAEPNSMVEVFDNGVSLGVVQADENGNWRLPTTGLLAEGPHSFTIEATDLAGNVSEPSNPLALNVTKPLASASPTGEQSMAFTIDRDQTDDVLTVGGTGPWTYAVADGQLPDGLSIDPNTGAISGTAERLQDVVVEVLVSDANGETVRIPIRIVIEAAAKPLLVSSGVGTNTNLGNIPSSMVNGYTYGDGTAVTLYDTTDFLPSGQTVPFVGYKGEVRVSLDDLDGNGRPDIVAAAGVGAQPHIRVLDIETGASRMSFLAFDQGYRGGMFVSTGDINGDHHADIAVVSGLGSRSHVKVFDGKTGAEIASFYAFEEGFTGGATLAVGDTDGDGVAEIIVGKGPGDLPLVRIFEQGANGWQMRSEFLAFEKFFRGGVFVAVGDIGGDNRIEIAVGANAGASASVALFDAKTKNFIDQFYAYGQLDNVGPFKGGARVAIEDYNRDGVAELITGAGPGSYPHLRVWEVDDTIREIASLLVAESGYTGGVHLG